MNVDVNLTMSRNKIYKRPNVSDFLGDFIRFMEYEIGKFRGDVA